MSGCRSRGGPTHARQAPSIQPQAFRRPATPRQRATGWAVPSLPPSLESMEGLVASRMIFAKAARIPRLSSRHKAERSSKFFCPGAQRDENPMFIGFLTGGWKRLSRLRAQGPLGSVGDRVGGAAGTAAKEDPRAGVGRCREQGDGSSASPPPRRLSPALEITLGGKSSITVTADHRRRRCFRKGRYLLSQRKRRSRAVYACQ